MDRQEPRQTYSIIDPGSGELLTFDDTYNGQENNYEAARTIQTFILDLQAGLDSSFLQLGAALKIMRDNEYYKALGVPSFRAWMNSPEIHFGYRLGIDLIRIVEELLPRLGENPTLSVSAMRELLPLIGTEHEAILGEVADEIGDMTVRDAREHIRELRGGEEHTPSVIFRARVERGEVFHKVWITRVGGANADVYDLTSPAHPIRVKVEDWSRWQDRFSEGFIDYG